MSRVAVAAPSAPIACMKIGAHGFPNDPAGPDAVIADTGWPVIAATM